MKINFPILDEPISLEHSTILSVESIEVFASLVREFYYYSDESRLKLFDGKLKSLKPSEFMIVTDILGYNLNSTAVLKLVYNDLEKQLNDNLEAKAEIENLLNRVTDLIGQECLESDLDLEYGSFELNSLFKLLGIKIEVACDTLFEKMFEILQVYQYLVKKKLLVFVNSLSYFKKSEIERLIEYIQLSNLRVLFIEPRKIEGFQQYVLDEDFCLLLDSGVKAE
ncbi:type II-A CRISPR-associated protein Csn2 [Streptococcus downei]|uniref:CRISPR-associated protein csn2 n=1 Tax=Streptococcus downei MFe28 TaxID=764290 RepID=A0A380JDD8_STRDO|nr:type II-A CRISPR-associated protein Csn2 [Streptococcus downei]EFQ56674.1 CRISPR-associated protein, Csn2 family [Streptococcus downei F0415]SUN35992.1 CRISPR-associated protein csn2 [Streptococcus downei MFe28]